MHNQLMSNVSDSMMSKGGDWVAYERTLPDGTAVTSGEKLVLSESEIEGTKITTQLWRGGPALSKPFDFSDGHVRGLVLAGSVSVHYLDSGNSVRLGVGDVFEFDRGTPTQWEYHEFFAKYEVIVDPQAS